MDQTLFKAAAEVRERAHAPYSRFHVGAAIRAADGSVHTGANVEIAAYPLGACAEMMAIGHMVGAIAAGPSRRIAMVCVVADALGGHFTTPCGGCRQRLAEFSGPDTVICCADPAGNSRSWSMAELLPEGFRMDWES
jgi:cytidine deaminase